MEEKYSLEETKTLRTGIIAVLVIFVAVFLTISHNASIKRKNLGGAYRIYANFGRTDGLSIGNAVRMAGVNIGRIIAAELDENFTSKLTLEINSKYKIPDDSSASIVSFGLIGGKYIEIDVGGSEDYIAAGGQINYTQDAMVLEELLDRIISIGKAKHKNVTEEKKEDVDKKSSDKTDLEINDIKEKTNNITDNTENVSKKAEDSKEVSIAEDNIELDVEKIEDNTELSIEKTEDEKEMNDE